MKAIIELDVPDWQIGQEVSVYFPDTMMKRSICKEDVPKIENTAIIWCKDCKYLIDHYGFMDDGYCESMREKHCLKFKPNADWYCADGENAR